MSDLRIPTTAAREVTAASRIAVSAWMAFVALALGQLLVDIDDVVVNIALPSIAADVALSSQQLPWAVNAYLLCFGGLLLLGGRLADRYGHRTVLLAGVAVFVAASLAGSLAFSAGLVIGARAGQGVAAALLAPAAMSLLVHTFPEPSARSRVLGVWGAVTGLGAVGGLVVGGVVTEQLGWRWIFTGNAAIASLVGVSILVLLPGGTGDRRVRIDPVGAVLATVGLATAVYALHDTVDHGWLSARTALLAGCTTLVFVLAAATWRRSDAPLVPAALLKDRTVLVSDGCAMLTGGALMGTFYFVSLHLQQVLGYSPLEAAFAYLPLVAGLIVAAGAASPLVPRLGVRPVLATGMASCAAGLTLLAWLGMSLERHPFLLTLAPGLVVCGLGLGLAFVSLTVTAIPGGEGPGDEGPGDEGPGDEGPGDEGPGDGGVASGLYNTALQVGGAIGIAVLAAVSTSRADHLHAAGQTAAEALTGGRTLALLIAAGLMMAGVGLAWMLPSGAGRSSTREGA
jgi:EmrB/QacA subfamily drug resistance transporter